GILAFKGTVLQNMEELLKGNGELDLMRDVIPYLISKGGAVYGYLSKAFWYDVGSTEAYEKLDHKLVDNMFSFLFK
ncbi:MAG: sugar phosphate nucleotidyltransferase, partial [Candidatus Bathyarchaeia archaeon]